MKTAPGEMTTLEVEFLKHHHTVIVPVGATWNSTGRIGSLPYRRPDSAGGGAPRRAKTRRVVAPPVNYALSYPHVGFKGLVYMRIPTFMAMIEDGRRLRRGRVQAHRLSERALRQHVRAWRTPAPPRAERLPRRAAYPHQLLGWDAARKCGRLPSPAEGHARQRGRDVRRSWQSTANLVDMDEGERRVPELPEFTVNPAPVHAAFFFSNPRSVMRGDQIGHLGRCPIGQSANRRGLHQRGRRLDRLP